MQVYTRDFIDYGMWTQEIEALLPLIFMLLMTLIVFRAMQSIDLYTASRAATRAAPEPDRKTREVLERVEERLTSLEASCEFADSILLQRDHSDARSLSSAA